MKKTNVLTEKQKFIGGLVVKHHAETGKGLCAKQLITIYKDELKAKGIDTVKVNSANATMASLANADKDFLTKSKDIYNEKMLTFYTPTKKFLDYLDNESKNENENNEE